MSDKIATNEDHQEKLMNSIDFWAKEIGFLNEKIQEQGKKGDYRSVRQNLKDVAEEMEVAFSFSDREKAVVG